MKKMCTFAVAAFCAALATAACSDGSGSSSPPDGGEVTVDDDDDIGNADDNDDTDVSDDDTDDTDVDDDVTDDDDTNVDDDMSDMDASMPEPDDDVDDDVSDDDIADDDTNGGVGGTPSGGMGGNTSVGGSGGMGGNPSSGGVGGTPSGGMGGDPSVAGSGGTPASGGVGGIPAGGSGGNVQVGGSGGTPSGGSGGMPPTGCPGGCEDGNACTTDSCVGNACVHRAVQCNDGNACNGVETCNPVTGCTNPPDVDCDDGVPCTVDSCSPATGACSNVPNSGACNDGVSCTIDSCNATTGCESTPDDGLCGSNQTCDENTGCENIPVTWDTIGTPAAQTPIQFLSGTPEIQGIALAGTGGNVSALRINLVQPQGAPPPPGGSGGEGGSGGMGGAGGVDAGPPPTGTPVVSQETGCVFYLPETALAPDTLNEGDFVIAPSRGDPFHGSDTDPCTVETTTDVSILDPGGVDVVEGGVLVRRMAFTAEDADGFLGQNGLLAGARFHYVLPGTAPIGQRTVSGIQGSSVGMAVCPDGQLFLASNASPRVIEVSPDGTRVNHDVPGAGPDDGIEAIAANALSGAIQCDANGRVYVSTLLGADKLSYDAAREASPPDPSLLVEIFPSRVLELNRLNSERTEVLSLPLGDAVVVVDGARIVEPEDPEDTDFVVLTAYRDILTLDNDGLLTVARHLDASTGRWNQNVGGAVLEELCAARAKEAFTDVRYDPNGDLWWLLNPKEENGVTTPPRVARCNPDTNEYDGNVAELTDYTPELLGELRLSSPLEFAPDGVIVLGAGVINSLAIDPVTPRLIITQSTPGNGVVIPLQ